MAARDAFPDLPGEVKDNFVQLHFTTGESFESMARRITDPAQLAYQDAETRKATTRLAEFLRTQEDDPDVLAAFRPEPTADPAEAAETRAAAADDEGTPPPASAPPRGRTARSPQQTT